jgi:hypothetical protein
VIDVHGGHRHEWKLVRAEESLCQAARRKIARDAEPCGILLALWSQNFWSRPRSSYCRVVAGSWASAHRSMSIHLLARLGSLPSRRCGIPRSRRMWWASPSQLCARKHLPALSRARDRLFKVLLSRYSSPDRVMSKGSPTTTCGTAPRRRPGSSHSLHFDAPRYIRAETPE